MSSANTKSHEPEFTKEDHAADAALKAAAEAIVRDSDSAAEIQKRLATELRHPYGAAISVMDEPTDNDGRIAKVLVQALGGLTLKNGRPVMMMLHGRCGTISL